MKFKRTQICSGIAAALGTGVLALPVGVLAQESTRIEVTGSRIQSLVTTSAPVAEVSAEEFKFTGTTRVEDLLNTLPQLASSFDSFTVNPTVGYATADLRGLGTARTLVLVNGQRLQPGGIRSEARDLNQIPAALIKRVDILTGGASAVYGADAMAGVVNFILDNEFEGFSINAGISGYQHNNDNTYMRGLMDRRGFTYPTGSSGIDGKATNIDLAWGSKFADNKGHAMAYLTWRKNDELRQGARDWSSCALNAAGTACGGSGTTPNPTFFQDFSVVDAAGNPIIGYGEDPANPGTFISTGQVIASIASGLNPDGTWGAQPGPYNFAPINHYQRPDERWTFGSSLRFEVNKNFKPFFESMFSNTNTRVQIAESGTFFANRLDLNCNSPQLGSFCNDLGQTTVSYLDANGNEVEDATAFVDRSKPVAVYVGKRNVEGGPRVSVIESSSFRVVAGTEGELGLGSWTYNASFLYGRTTSNESNLNDFLTDRVGSALLGCPAGSFSGCVPYNVWVPGGVTAAQAEGLSGVGMRQGTTSLRSLNAYLTGDIGFTVPTARDPISLVVGAEIRDEGYEVRSDTNMATGNFTGLGGPRPPVSGEIGVKELFFEASVPLLANMGFVKSLDADLGFRTSNYDTSGRVNTYKVGFNSNMGMVRLRGGYNRAIRAANTTELFDQQSLSLWSGADPCAGDTPTFTREQCANTGVAGGQYGNISASPASQYNQFTGGNPNLKPETGDTWTLGLIVAPMQGLTISADYFDIKITKQIGTIGASTVLSNCALTGDPFLCSKVRRNATTGDLWRGDDPATSGYVENLNDNFGDFRYRGLDLAMFYNMRLFGGRLNASFSGTRMLEAQTAPLPGVNDRATYDCVGVINPSCNAPQTPKWRHSMSLRYSKDFWTTNVRWRHVGALSYTLPNGAPGTQDRLLFNNGGVGSYNFLDLSASFDIGKNASVTLGVNNVADKAPPLVGSTVVLNANSIGGYDQLGRYLFANVGFKF